MEFDEQALGEEAVMCCSGKEEWEPLAYSAIGLLHIWLKSCGLLSTRR